MPTHQKRPSSGRPASGSSTSDTQGLPQESAAPAAADAPRPSSPKAGGETLKITDLKDLSIQKLTQIAKDKNVVGATGMRKQEDRKSVV